MNSIHLAFERGLTMAGSDRGRLRQQDRIARLQEQLSTGLRVNRASDDAAAFATARRLDGLQGRFERYQRSIDASQSWVDHTQDALDQLAERFTQVYERGIRANSQVFDAADRAAEADQLEGMLDEMVDMLNASDNGEYIFAGTRTKTEPFALAAGPTVTYGGNAGGRTREIGDGLELDVNITGDHVMDTGRGYTIFETVKSLADAVRTGDATQMSTALEQVIAARDHVIDVGADAGGIANRLDAASEQLRQATLRVEGRRSEVEDADLAATIMEFQEAQTGLQAALKVTASVMQTSLMDYLR